MTTFKMNQNTEPSIPMEPTPILQEESEDIDEAIKTAEEMESSSASEEKPTGSPMVITDETIETNGESDEEKSQEIPAKTKPSLMERLASIFHF